MPSRTLSVTWDTASRADTQLPECAALLAVNRRGKMGATGGENAGFKEGVLYSLTLQDSKLHLLPTAFRIQCEWLLHSSTACRFPGQNTGRYVVGKL